MNTTSYSSILHIFLNGDYSRFRLACLASSIFGPMTYICGVLSAGCCWTPVLSLSHSSFIRPFSFILPYSLRSSIPFHFPCNTGANSFLFNPWTSSDELLTEECTQKWSYTNHPYIQLKITCTFVFGCPAVVWFLNMLISYSAQIFQTLFST